MPLDCHIHVGSAGKGTLEERAARLTAMFDRHGIGGALVLPVDGLFSSCLDHAADNDFVSEFCARAPDRLKAAFSVNPLLGDAALQEIRRCCGALGLRVLKLHPWLQGFSVTSDPVDRVARLCEDLGITVVLHDGTPPYSTPLQIARLARDYPGLRVVSGHAGLNDLWPDAVAAARRYPNFNLCLCGVPYYVMQRVVAEVPPSQVCVGSDLFEDSEDLLWYRWAVWRAVAVPQETRDQVENITPRALFGAWG